MTNEVTSYKIIINNSIPIKLYSEKQNNLAILFIYFYFQKRSMQTN